jgi:hypothetical protein
VKVALALFAATLLACGTDVDLGGTAGPDDASVDATQCGNLVAPGVTAGCRACDRDAADCQQNGCYGGYWCDTVIADCHVAPKTCP